MKSIINVIIFVAALFVCGQASAQNVLDLSYEASSKYNNLRYVNDGFQNFSYYSNPEIRRLENEVDRHGNLYRWDQYGNKKYSAVTYQNLSETEKKSFRSSASNFNPEIFYKANKSGDDEKDKTLDQRAEEYFNKMIAPYLNSDGSVNKQKLRSEISKDLNALFEMKETEKQKEVTKLENQLKVLQNTLADRKKNKQEIIEQRMNDLVGLPNTLRW